MSRGTTPRLPLVVSCRGGTPASHAAAELARRVAELGAAETAAGLDGVAAAGRAGRRIFVVDGCPSACGTKLLEARGVHPTARVDLGELGDKATASDVAARLRSQRAERPQTRLVSARPTASARSKRAHGVDDYLLAIDGLASPVVACGALVVDAPTLAAHVSHVLGVSRPSAGEMLARLEHAGLVERNARKELLLTVAGRSAADRAVRRHRLIERFATDVLGYSPAQSFERARQLESAFDDDALERLAEALGEPDRCPHGWPLDAAQERRERQELTVLSALAPGDTAAVVRVAEHDGPLLARLLGLGLAPGAEVAVECARPELVVRVDGRVVALEGEAAEWLLVRHGG